MQMEGKVIVVTGATSGIGEVAALRLAGMGARVLVVARNPARAEATLQKLRAIAPVAAHRAYLGDLSSIAECKRVAAEIAAAEPRIDVLINNAGALFGHREVTADGLERTFATNHMAYFIMTLGLRQPLQAAGQARVVSTASLMHKGYTLDFDDLQMEKSFSGTAAYGKSKLCNILFTRELARRWAQAGVVANCLHPGYVATRFGDESGPLIAFFNRIGKRFAISPEKGAQTIIHLASAPEAGRISGQYWYRCQPTTPSKQAQDDAAARRLWEASAALAGIDG